MGVAAELTAKRIAAGKEVTRARSACAVPPRVGSGRLHAPCVCPCTCTLRLARPLCVRLQCEALKAAAPCGEGEHTLHVPLHACARTPQRAPCMHRVPHACTPACGQAVKAAGAKAAAEVAARVAKDAAEALETAAAASAKVAAEKHALAFPEEAKAKAARAAGGNAPSWLCHRWPPLRLWVWGGGCRQWPLFELPRWGGVGCVGGGGTHAQRLRHRRSAAAQPPLGRRSAAAWADRPRHAPIHHQQQLEASQHP